MLVKLIAFVPPSLFKPSLMFAGRAGADSRVEHFKGPSTG